MFVRIKKAGRYEYLQIVENHRERKKSVQRVVATLGRVDHLRAKGEIENLVRSLARFSDRPLLIVADNPDRDADQEGTSPSPAHPASPGDGTE